MCVGPNEDAAPHQEEEECAICLEPNHTPANSTVLDCGHSFHTTCCVKLLLSDRSRGYISPCPICRDVPAPNGFALIEDEQVEPDEPGDENESYLFADGELFYFEQCYGLHQLRHGHVQGR